MSQSKFASVARFFSGEDIKGRKSRKPSRVAIERFRDKRKSADDTIRSVMLKMEEPDAPLAILAGMVNAACAVIVNLIESGIHGGFRLMALEDETWYFNQIKVMKDRLAKISASRAA